MKGFEGYTGGMAENEVLGETIFEKTEKEKEQEFRGEYVSFEQAVDIVKNPKLQPFKDPTEPHEKPFPYDVQATLVDLLSLANYKQVRFYTAVGSYLDKKYGVDAFFELDLGEGNFVRATLDMTQNPNKQEYKADIVFQWPREGLDRRDPGDRAVWLDKVREVAKEVASVLQTEARVKGIAIKALNEEQIEKSAEMAVQKKTKVHAAHHDAKRTMGRNFHHHAK
jgi:hypothetical protein